MTGPIIVPPRIAAYALGCECSRENGHSRQNGVICPKPLVLVRFGLVAHTSQYLSSQTLRSPECFPANCFQMPVLEKIPKKLTSCEFTLFSIPLFTDSPLSRVLSCPFSSSVKPNCSHQFETAS